MTTETIKTKSQKEADNIAALLRARNSLLWVATNEEARVEGYLAQAASAAGFTPVFWDVGQGVTDLSGKVIKEVGGSADAGETLLAIKTRSEATGGNPNRRTVWIMRDLHKWIGDGPLGASPARILRNLAKALPGVKRDNAQAIIVICPTAKTPEDLQGHAHVINWPLPDRAEIAAILDAAIRSLPEAIRAEAAPANVRDLAIDAAVGLSGEEAASCYAKSLVQTKTIDPKVVSNEKKAIIAKSGVLTWVEPIEGGLDAVGGLENLKSWLNLRKQAYSSAARAYGLPAPKGAGLVGIPGCGKSLISKAVATAWEVPCLRLDLGALKGKFVGDSEGNIRRTLGVIEAIGRCVLWIDEIEKALAGATGGASADGGVSQDQLGTLLTWFNDRTTEAFVMVTANDIEGLPPELLRKGRFDEIFFVGFPNEEEAQAVLRTALRKHGRAKIDIDVPAVALECSRQQFTGAEIAELVPAALFTGFADGAREITSADLIAAAKDIVPLIKTSGAKIERLQKFLADGRAVPATRTEGAKDYGAVGNRVLDLDAA